MPHAQNCISPIRLDIAAISHNVPLSREAAMSRQPFPQTPQPRGEFRIDILVLILAITAVGYSFARFFIDRNNYNKGHEAYRRVDCTAATDRFDRILNSWRITDIGRYAALAEREKAQCLDFKSALAQEQAGDVPQTILTYNSFIDRYSPTSFLVQAARDRVESLFASHEATTLATPPLCEQLEQIQQNAIIPEPATHLPPLYFACAQTYTASGDFDKATPLYETVLDEHPEHPLVPEVKAAWAKSLVTEAEAEGAGNLPAPMRAGSSGSSATVIEIRNDSPEPMRIVFSGPEGRIEELPECTSCETYVGQGPESCPAQGPVERYTLKPGEYEVVVKAIGERPVNPFKGNWSLGSGWNYNNCFYIVTNPNF